MPTKKSWLDAEIADHLHLGTALDARGEQQLAGWLRVAARYREPARPSLIAATCRFVAPKLPSRA